jgi:catechol 1,2-dioxygenase
MSNWNEEFKTILFYIGGIVGFVALTAWLTSSGSYQAEGLELLETPARARALSPTATRWPMTPTPTLDPAAMAVCELTPGSMRYGYKPGAPFTNRLASAEMQQRTERLAVSGVVYASDCQTPLPDTLIEVWQADPEGHYDWSADYVLRGQMRTDNEGRYGFTTIRPGRYVAGVEPLPAHINFRVSYRDQAPLFTQLFFTGDPFLNQFPFVVPPLIISLTQQTRADGAILTGEFNIVLPVRPQGPKFNRVDGY